jgi:hypothetical protein
MIRYTCQCCGKEHEEWPSLTYSSPSHYYDLSPEEKLSIAELTSDFCIIKYDDQTDKFIRCILIQKVIDHCFDLEYGVWVSLSDKSFEDYSENFNNENHETEYFGWLSNYLPSYDNTSNIPTSVYTKKGNLRPEIIPHHDFEHQFVKDYYNGITKIEAERRINEMFKSLQSKEK